MSLNRHGKVVLYARVSTEEQAKSGYSLAQQMEALRSYASRERYEVLEEIVDRAQSGASLERPGMDRMRDLVAAGGVSMALAQDRDRFSREPAYSYLLRREFEENGTKLRALNDRGDDSPEGQLTDGILDQLAKYERTKIAERSRRGKLRKAQEGKIVAGHTSNYGFRYNATRDGYDVEKEEMAVVQRAFRMVGTEGISLHGAARAFEREGLSTPGGQRYWNKVIVKRWLVDDVYRPHSVEEIAALVAPEVAARLDPESSYGIWWFNRRRTTTMQVSESNPNGTGRTYRKHSKVAYKDRDEWIAVPVPDSGIPREVVDAARAMVASYRSHSKADGRFWELSGGIMCCGECGRYMEAHAKTYKTQSGSRVVHYYRCRVGTRRRGREDVCQNNKTLRAEKAHAAVWELIRGLLSDPERLRASLSAMIEKERGSAHTDPEHEKSAWLERLTELDGQRSRAQDLAIEGLLGRDELRTKLAFIDDTRGAALRELKVIEKRQEHVAKLEVDRDVLLESYASQVPDNLDDLVPEERHRVYRLLRLQINAHIEGTLEVRGTLNPDRRLGVSDITSTL